MKQLFLLFLICSCNLINAQENNVINFAMATHPLMVKKLYNTDNETIVVLEITNQSENGYFCADKDIELKHVAKGIFRSKLLSSEGIPTCPDVHKFVTIGEKLVFTLHFEKIKSGLKYLDVIEKCHANCFAIYGIVLDKDLNDQINRSFRFYENKETLKAIEISEQIASNIHYPYANKYFNAIHFLASTGNYPKAKNWYAKLKQSSFNDTKQTLNRLMAMPYYRYLL